MQLLTPQRLVDALGLTCRPRTPRDALVLAVQACVLQTLGDRGIEPEGGDGGSLLSAYHPLSTAADAAAYPSQRYRLPAPDSTTTATPLLLLLKPVALDIPVPSSAAAHVNHGHESEPGLVLYGRAVGRRHGGRSDEDAIHRLALRVGEFLAAAEATEEDEEGAGDGGDSEDGRAVVRIQGAGGVAWRCRLGALGGRLATHLLSKLLPPAYFPHQLPTLLAALPPPPPPSDSSSPPPTTPPTPAASGSSSYNSPFPLLLAFLPAPNDVLALASTCRECRALGGDAGAWTALLDRDFPDWRPPPPSSSSSSSSPSTGGLPPPPLLPPPPPPPPPSTPVASYRRRWQEKRRREGGSGAGGRRGMYRPFDGQGHGHEGWRHFFVPLDHRHQRRPLPTTPGGVLLPPFFDRDPENFEGSGNGLWWPRPRYIPFFGPPPLGGGGTQPPHFAGWDDWAWT